MKIIEKLKFLMWDAMNLIVILAVVAIVLFVGYGIETDCPNTDGYVYCGKN